MAEITSIGLMSCVDEGVQGSLGRFYDCNVSESFKNMIVSYGAVAPCSIKGLGGW